MEKMDELLKAEMTRALNLLEALKVAKEIEGEIEPEYQIDTTRHAKTELRMIFKAIRKHSVQLEKDWKA
jgi:hypothetical protein